MTAYPLLMKVPSRARSALLACAAVTWFVVAAVGAQAKTREIFVKPSETDPAIKAADDPHYVAYDPAAKNARILLFLPGTGGRPHRSRLLNTAVKQGYRAIFLSCISEPAVAQACIGSGDRECAAKFRQKRVFGDNVTPIIADTRADSIVNRFTKLLQYLAIHDHGGGWDQYLAGDAPLWIRIGVAGQSQGGGMAAFLAKKLEVARVIMFSGGWDTQGQKPPVRPEQIADWYVWPSATPPERWFGTYHANESQAAAIAKTYEVLGIPISHVVVFNAPVPQEKAHGFGVSSPTNVAQWRTLLGAGSEN